MISLLIEYIGVDEVGGGLTRQIMKCYLILFMWLNLWHVSSRPGEGGGGVAGGRKGV